MHAASEIAKGVASGELELSSINEILIEVCLSWAGLLLLS